MKTTSLALLLALSTAALGADEADATTPPSMISGANPAYTPEAIEHGVEGTMSVRCIVNVQGQVRECKVIKGLPFMDRAVIAALESRKYRPALSQGKPVQVSYTFDVRLKLPER